MTDQNNAALDLGTSSGGRAYIAEYFASQLRRHDCTRYINDKLAADFVCVLARHQSKLRAVGVQAGEPLGDERLAFEAFQRATGLHELYLEWSDKSGRYRWASPQEAWEAWQARAALACAPVAAAIHWPDCWDTAAYPTLESALAATYATFRCQNTDTHPAPDEGDLEDPSALAALADGLESIPGNENAALAAIYIRQQAERLASETVSNADAQAWIDLFWSVSKELNCLPSSFVDGNAHVLRAAAQARTALSAQTGAQKNGGGKA